MLRLFKSFEAQPRLAIVTATLKTAAPDFGHFMFPSLISPKLLDGELQRILL